MTDEDLAEWRSLPTTEAVRDAIRETLGREERALTEAYWSGHAVPEDRRLAFLRKRELWEDIFEGSAEDFRAAMGQ